MAKIFISYRRTDSAATTGRIYDRLVARFKRRNVFKDVDDIPAGVDFGAYIQRTLRECAVMLVVIGRDWLDARTTDGGRRLDDPADWVRAEIETAFALKLTVIPLLVEGTSMPQASDMPKSLRDLARLNALPVRNDPDFSRDIERAMVAIEHARAASRTTQGALRRGVASQPTPKQTVTEQPAVAQPVQPDTVPFVEAGPPAADATIATLPPSVAGADEEPHALPKQPASSRKFGARGVALAALAAVLVVVSFGALLSLAKLPIPGVQSSTQSTQTAGAYATQTAAFIRGAALATQQVQTETAPTATARTFQGKLPLVAPAPGYGCEQGGISAFWQYSANWSTSFCRGTYTHLATTPTTPPATSTGNSVTFKFYNSQTNVRIPLPADFTISVRMNNLSANGQAAFLVSDESGADYYSLIINPMAWTDPMIWTTYGRHCVGAICTTFSPSGGDIYSPEPHTLTLVFQGHIATWYIDGVKRSTAERSATSIDLVSMGIGGLDSKTASVDFSNFTIAQG